MDIKLIAIDMDGTLLTSSKELSARNRQALEQCSLKGIHIVPATGRIVDGIPHEILEIPGVRYVISTNGAVVADLKCNQIITSRKMDWQTALKILNIVDEYPVMYDAYIDGRGKSEERFMAHLEDYGIDCHIKKLIMATRDVVPDIRESIKALETPVDKVNIIFKNDEMRGKVREMLSFIPDILITSSLPNNLEINHKDATKGDALLILADYLGVKREQTMAFGDGENDLTMIQKAGIGVVMENGDETLKQSADFITRSNDKDGVALAIEHFVFS